MSNKLNTASGVDLNSTFLVKCQIWQWWQWSYYECQESISHFADAKTTTNVDTLYFFYNLATSEFCPFLSCNQILLLTSSIKIVNLHSFWIVWKSLSVWKSKPTNKQRRRQVETGRTHNSNTLTFSINTILMASVKHNSTQIPVYFFLSLHILYPQLVKGRWWLGRVPICCR